MLHLPHKSAIPFGEAKLHYEPGDYRIITQGTFVRCAITQKAIPLDDLKYWCATKQQAYASPEAVLKSFGLEKRG